MAANQNKTAIVVGAGIVGVSSAYMLQKAGFSVTLVDRVGPCSGTSYGNAGAIVVDGCVPNSMPGILKDIPSMLFDATGPLTVRWSHLAKATPWLLRFMMEAREERVRHNAKFLYQITKHAGRDWSRLMKSLKLDDLMKDVGWLKVYESDEGFAQTLEARELMSEVGCPFDILDATDIQDLEPNLNAIFKHGIFQKKSRFLLNPEKVVHGIADAFKHIGGQIEIAEISTVSEMEAGVVAKGNGKEFKADKLVIAAGAWSKILADQFGANVLLDAERGYHMMLPALEDKTISRPIVYGEKSFVLAPMERGIRMTSQVEIAGLERGPDFRRIRKLLPLAKRMLPTLNTQEQDVWLGHRPSTPDSLPIIGCSPKSKNVIFAFGHQHYGMTMGPTTARIVRDIALGKEDTIELWPYRADRF
ncbi:NAD(P)/FAD-dependent oxidoreductase [Sneathiella glossodoripedis]|uniref:NAD(P)/FAD-dependent oxidoreductase n=1 Tax=Sneathiella glossodoripedis TaxID=418853 RepID=UPI0004725CF4|nr:FAD-binding oxidoreductase [Sneathiella glossodoripedis]